MKPQDSRERLANRYNSRKHRRAFSKVFAIDYQFYLAPTSHPLALAHPVTPPAHPCIPSPIATSRRRKTPGPCTMARTGRPRKIFLRVIGGYTRWKTSAIMPSGPSIMIDFTAPKTAITLSTGSAVRTLKPLALAFSATASTSSAR